MGKQGGVHIHLISLRYRIFSLLAALIIINLAGGTLTLWYVQKTQQVYTVVMDRDLRALEAAQELQTSLVMQKGFVTYFFLSSDPEWLQQLGLHHMDFERWLKKARGSTYIDRAHLLLNEVESQYLRFVHSRDEVLRLYKEGDRQAGAELHWKVRDQFHTIHRLCREYAAVHEQRIVETRQRYGKRARWVALLAWGAIPGGFFLGLLLAYILSKQVLEPIRKLASGPLLGETPSALGNEVKTLSRRVETLVEYVGRAESQLEESREHLMQSEKLALVGKLAAGVAHSIRNPLTSVKMRLFSLERSLTLDPVQREDFDVISEEIRHLDTIVRSFLEFSRPPKLKFQIISLSDVVDMTLQLLRHRIESYGVEVQVSRDRRLPKAMGDSEQLKEVLVNLLLNACEAMGDGGVIQIQETLGIVRPLGNVAVIRVKDSGPGIPRAIQDKIFQPFFSSKEEGSGLGLSIARRIVEEHGGWLHFQSTEGKGATFVITLPCKEGNHWLRS